MRIAYVDDTKQQGKREGMGQLVAFGAVIFEENQVQPFAEAFRAAYDALGIPHELELKWSYPQGNNWFRKTNNTALQTPTFREGTSTDSAARTVLCPPA